MITVNEEFLSSCGHIFYFKICVLAHPGCVKSFFAMKKQRQKVLPVLTVIQFTVKFLAPSKRRSYFQGKSVTLLMAEN